MMLPVRRLHKGDVFIDSTLSKPHNVVVSKIELGCTRNKVHIQIGTLSTCWDALYPVEKVN